jgi:hypothetical protein
VTQIRKIEPTPRARVNNVSIQGLRMHSERSVVILDKAIHWVKCYAVNGGTDAELRRPDIETQSALRSNQRKRKKFSGRTLHLQGRGSFTRAVANPWLKPLSNFAQQWLRRTTFVFHRSMVCTLSNLRSDMTTASYRISHEATPRGSLA